MVAIISRAAWGAGGSTAGRGVALSQRRWFVAHWPGGAVAANESQVVRNIDSFHRQNQGWAIIGYNYLIGRSGAIFEGAGLNIRGIHSPPRNIDGWGVCFLIAPGEALPQPMRNSARALYDWLNRQAGRTLGRAGHSTHFATACPGPAVMAWINAGMPSTGGQPPPQPPPNPGGAPPWPGRILRQPPIMRGDDVRTIQTRYRARGWTGQADGAYGPITEGATRIVQQQARLSVDGRVGPNTWPAAWRDSGRIGGGATPAPPPAAPPFPGRLLRNTRPMMSGADIRQWQTRMRQRGFSLDADGWYGPISEARCRTFQTQQRIGVDGIVGPITWGRTFGP
jgi:peptidoglycan hydrolase-like protein with peptidoglycan-binding domain